MEDRKEKKSLKTYDSSKDYKSGKEDKDKKGGYDDYNKYSFQFFVHKEWCEYLQQNNGKVLDELKSNYKISEIFLDARIGITGLKGEVIKIIDKNMEKKINCVQDLLQKLQYIDVAELDIKSEDKKKRTTITIVLLIPEKFVSQVIGIKGKQISQIIKDSRAEVVVNQPIYKMYDRTVSLSGKIDYVLRALEIIYQLIEDKAPLLKDDDDNGPVQVLPLHKTRITAKFIFYESMVGFIIGTQGCHTKHLLDKYDVTMKVKNSDSRFRDLKRDENYLIGKLPKVQKAIDYIFKIADEYYFRFKSSHEHIVKVLIPTIFVPKLIGASGCMIKELANKSGGASIKIKSDKNYEKFSSECCINVAGELDSKICATNLIVEQVEMFRSGGPVLMTGKTIFQDLAAQVNDSYQAKESFLQDYADQPDQYKKKQKKSKSRSRSRSKSKSKGKYKSKSRNRSISNSDSSPKSDSRSNSIDMRYKRGQDKSQDLTRRKKSSEEYHQRRSRSRSLKKNKEDSKKHLSSNDRDSRSMSSEDDKYHKQQMQQRKQIKKSYSKSSMSPRYTYDDNSKIMQKNLEEIYKETIVPATTGESNLNHHYVNKKGEKIVEIKVEINNNIKSYLTYTKIENIQSKSNSQVTIMNKENQNSKEFFVQLVGKITENARAFQMIQEIIVESEQLINQKKESQIQEEEIKSQ